MGTDINNADTDGINDGVEYPPTGVPLSDPLIASDVIFINGFEL